VPDVHQFPGHIAVSALSASEIVIPIIINGESAGRVWTRSSDQLDGFDEVDQRGLEAICKSAVVPAYRNLTK
jgi:GAF domain-containing protein